MISAPLVSIVVPCYNVEKYVEACVDSVLKQDYQNWECILINDGSSDHTLEIIKSFETKDQRFQVFTQENSGLSATRNRGIKISKGAFLFFLDSDDVLSTDAISTLVSSGDNNDIVTGITVTSKINGDIISKISQLYPPKEGDITYANTHFEVLTKAMESALTPVAQNRLYSKEFIDKNNLRFKNGILHEDELWFFETMLLAKNVKFVNHETYFYRTDNENSITRKVSDRNLESYISVLEEVHEKYIKKQNLDIAKWYNVYLKKIFLDFAIREREKLSGEVIRKLEKSLVNTYSDLPSQTYLSHKNEVYYRAMNKLTLKSFDQIKKHYVRNPVNSLRKQFKLFQITYLLK
ncbi:glycosyltransferase [Chryseobacterium sp. HSC-36S06]|uniref:glycosyltransferase n=1 Tax=Chryseobacterium sp. HSC-36S06 TaxID=2910970 RepID=UPI00209CF0F8|nr:glycosyltransferase [Chryseobacterium sp. HSC-36S06]MCP2038971.1 glycosyltransferase involved in cell wall biosynthesis [Chryseobacterium sp. HSC-36S06]